MSQMPDVELWTVIVGVFGPALVGAVTGLRTPGLVKALLALTVVTALTALQVLRVGMWTEDILTNLVVIVLTWQSFYGMLWKGTGIHEWLQARIPIKFGEVVEVEPVTPAE